MGASLQQNQSTKPYMVFVYSQKVHVEGQGTYELKVTNLVNLLTLKAVPLQPSLLNPLLMMTQGIGGNNKKSVCLTEEQASHFINKQKNLAINDAADETDDSNRITEQNPKQLSRLSTKMKNFGGAKVRLLATNRRTTVNNQILGGKTSHRQITSSQQNQQEVKQRKKLLAVKILKKVLNKKIRSHMDTVKINSMNYYIHRQQEKLKCSLGLFKVANIIQDKMKGTQYYAFAKIKEEGVSISQSRISKPESSGSSEIIKNSSINNSKENHTQMQKKFLIKTPTTAAHSLVQQTSNIHKNKLKAAKMLAFALEQKLLNRKLSFWLPFRCQQRNQNQGVAYLKELKIDYGQSYNRDQLEKELAQRFNKIELRKIEEDLDLIEKDIEDDQSDEDESKMQDDSSIQQQRTNTEGNTRICDPVRMMENNLANISAIYPRSPVQLYMSRNESFDLSYLERKQAQLKKGKQKEERKQAKQNERAVDYKNVYGANFDNSYEQEEYSPDKFKQELDNSYSGTDDDYSTYKIENNIETLNKDIFQVANELEQIKRLLLDEDQSQCQEDQEEISQSQKRYGKFKTEEDLLNYYEIMALDIDDQNDDDFFTNNQMQVALENDRRKPSWDIRHVKHLKNKNLNDSRENDFEGFEEIFD